MFFLPTLIVVTISLLYMFIGLLLGRFHKVQPEHLKSYSALLLYVCGPFMVINSFLNVDYTPERAVNMGLFFVITLLIQALFGGILALILRKKMHTSKARMICVCAICGNVGFFGLPLIQALFPGEALVMAYSSLFVMSMNVVAFTFGVYCVTGDRKHMSLKSALLNPTSIAIYISLPLFFLKVTAADLGKFSVIPDILGKMTTPICMILLGVRLSAANLKKLFTRPFVYMGCFLKLIVFPLFAYLCVAFLPLDPTFKVSVIILSACPSAAIVSSLAELYQVEEENAANVVLFASLLCVITLPVMGLIV